jgi:hydrophobe/amphiphile efflux-1 (HAE1) family protein
MSLTEVCIRRPVLAWMLMGGTVLFGIVAMTRIGISQFPDVDLPTVNISVSWEGASPEVMEHDVVDPLEESVVQIEGVRAMRSTSRQGSANITLELDLSQDIDVAMQDVQAKVSQAARHLPRDIDPPIVSKSNPEDTPILMIGLDGPFSQQVLADTARYRVKERLQSLPGVGEVAVGGAIDRNVRIWLDAEKLDSRGITVSDVVRALQAQHIELPAGRIETEGREISVRVMGEAIDLEALRGIVVKEAAGAPIRLSDVALVEDGFEDIRRVTHINGNPAQGMGIRKKRGSNAVAVGEEVKNELARIRQTLPPGMNLDINFDTTEFISNAVREIELELILSVLLTALVCWLFLGSVSSTLNVVLAIPMSLLGTIAAVYFLGFTLNTFTLLGLSLAVGIVVDDAIMVMENVHRHGESGKDRVRAAAEGTKEITFAALAATLAVVAIFTPVIFMQGVVGRFFLQFGVTLCIAVLLSYVEAMTLAPARLAQMMNVSREHRSRVGLAADRAFGWLSEKYARALAVGLRRPWTVLGVALVVLAASAAVFLSIQIEMVPSQDQSRLAIRMQAAVGSDLRETERLFKRAEDFLHSRPEVTRTFGSVGGGMGGGGLVNAGTLFVTMVPKEQRKLSQAELAAVIRKELNSYPGLFASIQDLSQDDVTATRGGKPVEFSVRGSDWNALIDMAESVKQQLMASGKVVDVETDYRIGMPELRITPDRARAADLGVSVEDVATTLNALVGGIRVGKYSDGARRLDVRMRLLATQRSRPEDVARLKVRTAAGELIPLSALVTSQERPALQAITRRDRERAITVTANIAPGSSQGEALEVVDGLRQKLPKEFRIVTSGASATFSESMKGLLFALLLGIAVAYMVLASQFNSYLHPVTVLTILPLSVAGAAFALKLTGQTVNIFSMIGLVLLMGIVKKNSIILVDYANQLRATGLDARAAMARAGPIRLRPILMTSIATMMAALPPALGIGPGSEIRMPMAIAVIGGLVVSTALSLLVVPAFYLLADRGKQRLRRRRAPKGEREPLAQTGT